MLLRAHCGARRCRSRAARRAPRPHAWQHPRHRARRRRYLMPRRRAQTRATRSGGGGRTEVSPLTLWVTPRGPACMRDALRSRTPAAAASMGCCAVAGCGKMAWAPAALARLPAPGCASSNGALQPSAYAGSKAALLLTGRPPRSQPPVRAYAAHGGACARRAWQLRTPTSRLARAALSAPLPPPRRSRGRRRPRARARLHCPTRAAPPAPRGAVGTALQVARRSAHWPSKSPPLRRARRR